MSRPSGVPPRGYPPVQLAPTDELASAFRRSRAYAALVMASDFVREPKPVTVDGALDESDIDALGATLDELLGEGGREAVVVVISWALAAGLVEAEAGHLTREAAADRLAGSDDDQLDTALAAFSGIDSLVAADAPDSGRFDALLAALVSSPDAGLARDELVERAWRAVMTDAGARGARHHGQREARAGLSAEIDWVIELLTDLGAARRDGGKVVLTPLGVWLLRQRLAAAGISLPLVGELATAPVGRLLEALCDYPPPAVAAELHAWIEATGVELGADRLAGHAVATDDEGERALALVALDALDERGEPAVRRLLDDPTCRPWAVVWLANHALATLGALAPGDPGAALVERLAVALVGGGAPSLLGALGALGEAAEQVAAVEGLWRVPSPHTATVLDAIAVHSRDKAVAKTARRARFKLHSHSG